MADKKISQLTGASLPLAGTEVLPIVQSNQTVKVATDDLTVKNIRSNATTGLLQIAGPGVSATRVMTVPDANFTAARTDAANSFSGNQTLATGNLVVGTAGKGIDFSANTHAAGMTSELLNDYEEGTWTPTAIFSVSNGNLAYASQVGRYTKVGRIVSLQGYLQFGETTASGNFSIGGLPFAASTASGNYVGGVLYADDLTGVSGQIQVLFGVDVTPNTMWVYYSGTGTRTRLTEANTGSNTNFAFAISYTV